MLCSRFETTVIRLSDTTDNVMIDLVINESIIMTFDAQVRCIFLLLTYAAG